MLTSSHNTARRQAGFSLVELMVAMVAGLIVIGAVIVFTISTVQAYSENIRSSRLTQELRTSINIMAREIRRAGYDSASVTRVLTATNPSNFNAVSDTGCIVYRYDRGVAGAAPAATEIRGFRLNAATGTLQMNATSGAIDCNNAAGWVDITDPNVVRITAFEPELHESTFCRQLDRREPSPGVFEYDMARGSVRVMNLCLRGTLAADNTISRHVTDSIRIRSENLTFEKGVASNVCAPAPADLPTPEELSEACAE